MLNQIYRYVTKTFKFDARKLNSKWVSKVIKQKGNLKVLQNELRTGKAEISKLENQTENIKQVSTYRRQLKSKICFENN